jgi:hypothetical protein
MTSVFTLEYSSFSEKLEKAFVLCEKWSIGRLSYFWSSRIVDDQNIRGSK